MHADATRALMIDQGYQPIRIVSWQRAITLIALDKVEVVEEYDAVIRAAAIVVQAPAVIRLRTSYRWHARPVKFSRINLYARDDYRCQYCGERCPIDRLTYDHVIPRSRGGRTTWDNIVSCCHPCNAEKADRTPDEAQMTLRTVPARPRWLPALQMQLAARSVPELWRSYLCAGAIERKRGTRAA